MGLRDEILEQPEVVGRLIATQRGPIGRITARLRERDFDTVIIAARGTSDHAAIYAQYVFGVRHRLPVALAAPSILSLYGVEPRFGRSLVIGVSQSGASPDVVGIVASAQRQGAPTIAITNDPGSDLAGAAEFVIDLGAGQERAIAATKTYTAELTALALLSAALNASIPEEAAAIDAIPRAMEAALDEAPAESAAMAFAALDTCTVLGRGYEYATAREWALKLKELAGVLADPYSAADFQHGPITLIERHSGVLVVAPSGRGGSDLAALIPRLAAYGADLLVVSDRSAYRALGRQSLALPAGVPEWLMPIVSIVPGQLFAAAVARARGEDPDSPRHLTKVTATR
jgi:glucosamine--fructose-6-phosphate aminotransferase (isomerizing)